MAEEDTLKLTPKELIIKLNGVSDFASGESPYSRIRELQDELNLLENTYPEEIRKMLQQGGHKVRSVNFRILVTFEGEDKQPTRSKDGRWLRRITIQDKQE
jgi:hypothetical protein